MRLGTYNTALEAAHAYDEAAIKVGRQSHTLNFPDDEAGAILFFLARFKFDIYLTVAAA